jgi:hypothetical protein
MDEITDLVKAISVRSYFLAFIGSLIFGTGLYGWNAPGDTLFTFIDVNANAGLLIGIGVVLGIPLWFETGRHALAVGNSAGRSEE